MTRNWDRDEAGERVAKTAASFAGLGGLSGLAGLLRGGSPNIGMSALKYGALGGAAQGVGDAILGTPDEHTFLNEAARGAVGGAVVNAGVAPYIVAKDPKRGANLIKILMKQGLSKRAAAAMILGGAGLGGAVGGGLAHGLESGLLHGSSGLFGGGNSSPSGGSGYSGGSSGYGGTDDEDLYADPTRPFRGYTR